MAVLSHLHVHVQGYTITLGPIWCLAGDEMEGKLSRRSVGGGELVRVRVLDNMSFTKIPFRVDLQLPRDHRTGNHARIQYCSNYGGRC